MDMNLDFESNGNQIKVFSYHTIDDVENDNIDVFVEVNGNTYSGQIYSLKNVESLIEKECLSGYFHDHNGIVLKRLDPKNIEKAIKSLVDEQRIEDVFVLQG